MVAKIVIKNKNEVYVGIECEESIAYELGEHFTFMVPGAQFSPKFRARLWDGKIRLFDRRTRTIYRGLVPKIIEFCVERDYKYEYINESYSTEFSLVEAQEFIKSLNLTKEPRDYQVEAFVHAIRNKRSLLLSPTASGKSLIIYLIIRYLLKTKKKGLIVVPTISLVEQMYGDFEEYGWKKADEKVHRIYQGKSKSTDKPITISTWQSIYQEHPKYFQDFEFVIGDEAHLYKANSLISILTKLTNASYRVGTTGTLDGTKTHKLVLEGLFGSVEKVTTTKELMDQKHIADFRIKCLLLKHDAQICNAAKKFDYQEEIAYLILNEKRNRFIRNLALSLHGNTLVLYQYVDKHGAILYKMIEEKAIEGRKCFFVYGKTDVETREGIRKIVETETNAVIIASYGTFSTGISIRNLHNIIFASPSKSRIRNLQSIGRGLRLGDNKEIATLYDIADDLKHKNHTNYTLKHFDERIKIYMEEKFNFKIYKIEL
jgi:superfamily II DNA or RNA helicase